MDKYSVYKGLHIGRDEPSDVSEEEVEIEIKNLINQNVTFEEKDAPAALGDVVNIDFEGFVDGVPFDGGKANKFDLELGSGTFIPGFEAQLVGFCKDQETDVCVTFPDNYQADNLKGKKAVFKCKINSVKVKIIPSFDDEFAKSKGVEDVIKLRSIVKAHLLRQKEVACINEYLKKICDYLVKNSEITVDENRLNDRVEEIITHYQMSISQYGTSMEEYLKSQNITMESFKLNLIPDATISLKIDMFYEHIVKEENIIVTEEELQEQYEYLKNRYGLSDEQLQHFKKEASDKLKGEIIRRKVSEFLINNND